MLINNSPQDVSRREQINNSHLARQALVDSDLQIREARRAGVSIQYLTEHFLDACILLNIKVEKYGHANPITNSLQYNARHVSNYIPIPKKVNQWG